MAKRATTSKVRPLADRLLVTRLEEEEVRHGSIVVPDTAKEKPQQAEAIAVGPGRRENGTRIPPEVKVGDRVLIGKYAGTEVTIDGQEYVILREEDVLAILD